jgi:putative FmdB family regulatory protein
MPTYEYECTTCGKHFEKFQNMSDEPIKVCPECGGKVTRLIGTGAGMILKGSGFYRNDYGRQSDTRTRCGRDTTCCGRDVPCESPPCGD